mmetsp:Transcript_39105/g.107749  ORF Transcript_39105/g.107749 Transcript_39105/m.107749 type:complete len:224 (-) Transcript_39105:126-797(-)
MPSMAPRGIQAQRLRLHTKVLGAELEVPTCLMHLLPKLGPLHLLLGLFRSLVRCVLGGCTRNHGPRGNLLRAPLHSVHRLAKDLDLGIMSGTVSPDVDEGLSHHRTDLFHPSLQQILCGSAAALVGRHERLAKAFLHVHSVPCEPRADLRHPPLQHLLYGGTGPMLGGAYRLAKALLNTGDLAPESRTAARMDLRRPFFQRLPHSGAAALLRCPLRLSHGSAA